MGWLLLPTFVVRHSGGTAHGVFRTYPTRAAVVTRAWFVRTKEGLACEIVNNYRGSRKYIQIY